MTRDIDYFADMDRYKREDLRELSVFSFNGPYEQFAENLQYFQKRYDIEEVDEVYRDINRYINTFGDVRPHESKGLVLLLNNESSIFQRNGK